MEYGEKVELIPLFLWAKLDHKHITETRWDWDAAIISTVTVGFVCSFTFVVLCHSPWALSLAQNLWRPPAKRKTSRSPLFYSSIKWLLQLPEFPLNQTAIKVTGWLIKLQQSFQHKGFSPRSPFPATPRLSSKTKHTVDMFSLLLFTPRPSGPLCHLGGLVTPVQLSWVYPARPSALHPATPARLTFFDPWHKGGEPCPILTGWDSQYVPGPKRRA